MLSGISQNKMSILERADRPDWSFSWTSHPNLHHNNPSLYFQTFKTSKVEKVRAWIPQSITSVSDRLSPVVLVPWWWHSLLGPYLFQNPKREIWHRSSDFWNLVPHPKMSNPWHVLSVNILVAVASQWALLCLNFHIRRKHSKVWNTNILKSQRIFWPKNVLQYLVNTVHLFGSCTQTGKPPCLQILSKLAKVFTCYILF